MISRCSSPIPAMIVCPVSSSDETRKVGSSSASRWRPCESLSWSPFVFGSIATEMTGSGNVIDSSTIGRGPTASVSPVVDCLSRRPRRSRRRRSPRAPRGGSRASGGCGRSAPSCRSVVLSDAVAGLDAARVDAEVRQLADVRVGHDLEDERRERRVLGRGPGDLLVGLRVDALDGRDVERARQVVDDRVEQRLHALVLERGAEQHRRDRVGERAGAERALDHLRRDRRLVLEVGLHQLVVVLGDGVDQRRGGPPARRPRARRGSRRR